jgi:hypothetical protein
MKKNILFFLWLFCFCAVDTNSAILRNSISADECRCSVGTDTVTNTMHKITLAQAKALVMAALEPGQRRLPGIVINNLNKNPDKVPEYSNNTRFLIFNVIWSATQGSDNVGWYGVDIYTGDVFSDVTECAEYYSKKLSTLQKKIRHSLHLTDTQYRKLKTNGPQCIDDISDKK